MAIKTYWLLTESHKAYIHC